MHITEVTPSVGYFARIFLPLVITVTVPTGMYFLYSKVSKRKELFMVFCILFLVLTSVREYLKKYYIVPEPAIPVRQAYDYLFYDKTWPREFERKRQIYLQARALRSRLYYLYDFALNPLWYILMISLIPCGIYAFYGDSVPGPRELLRWVKTLWDRKEGSPGL